MSPPRVVLERAYPLHGAPAHWRLVRIRGHESQAMCQHLHATAEEARTCVEARERIARLDKLGQ